MIDTKNLIQDKDTFRFVMPADLEKAADGSYRVKGLASTEKVDLQGEKIIQKGIDLTPIDKKKGILNWDHQKGPENTIGILDGYQRTEKGLYIEGRLFKNHTKAKAVREIMESLGENDHGRIGLSVEGQILERDSIDPRIIKKCRINAVAVTMNPVNTDTFADFVKSMNTSEGFEISAEETEEAPKSEEAMFTASQVMAIVQKALSIGPASIGAPDAKTGGDALQPSDMKADKPAKKKKKMRVMGADMYKSNLIDILSKLQVLYPGHSREVIWNAVKDRLETQFEKGIRIKNTSGKEREHKLYEDARQRGDYEENKDKSRAQLAQIAKESGAGKHDQAKIRAQNDAAKQVGERDHVRPNVKG